MKNQYAKRVKWVKTFIICSGVLLISVIPQSFSQCFTATVNSVNLTCNGVCTGSATAIPQGGSGSFVYAWSNTSNSPTITGLCAGTYSVTIADAVNTTCTRVLTAVISEPPAITATITTMPATCGLSNGSVAVNSTGGTGTFTYSWTTGATSQTISGLVAGTYTVTVKDANSCTKSAVATVGNNPSPVISNLSSVNELCNGGGSGSATVTANGGTGTLTYSWSNGITATTMATGLTAGSYSVSVTDANGCVVTSAVTITEPAALNIQFTVVNTTCGQSTGSASANVTGGVPAYTYAWSNGSSAQTANNVAVGSYTVTVTDANGCSKVNVATVNCTTGIDETPNSLFMNISPNPSHGSFVLECKFDRTGGTVISLTNILGEMVMLIDNVQQAGVYKKQVDTEQLSNGIYFLVVQQNNERLVKKVIIQ
ncbi:MAG: T9SS type A sorting domain-containing protein [Bacteroidetes bacterium]|nr:T9SS type A sorting domain-containing protein [Bacteroidota bacterium]